MISVCIAVHNGERYIKEQIKSILCQLGPDDEIVVSDDGSTDATSSILENFRDSRIKVYKYVQPSWSRYPHIYVCRNFENALNYVHGDYIFLADQDDWWMPDKVDKCVAALKNHTLVVHQAEMCDEMLHPDGSFMYKKDFVRKNYLAIKRGKYYGCTIAFRKELLKQILPFPKNLILHDQWIGCMAELTGDMLYVKEPLIRYRQHSDSASGGESVNSLSFRIRYRIHLFYHLMLRTYMNK